MLGNQGNTMRTARALSLFVTASAAVLLTVSAWAAQPSTTKGKPAAPQTVPAAAAKNPNNPVFATGVTLPAGIVPEEILKKMDKQTIAQRDAEIAAMAKKLKAMTPKERQAFFEANRKRYEALTPEQKKMAMERAKRQSAEYILAHKAEWEKNQAEQAKLRDAKQKEFLEKMPGIERAVLLKYKELRKTHGKEYAWHAIIDDAAHGGKLTPVPE
jgi:hypothetical protein